MAHAGWNDPICRATSLIVGYVLIMSNQRQRITAQASCGSTLNLKQTVGVRIIGYERLWIVWNACIHDWLPFGIYGYSGNGSTNGICSFEQFVIGQRENLLSIIRVSYFNRSFGIDLSHLLCCSRGIHSYKFN
ncbi:hypothetical protein D3C87_1435390 [compost metagenome]